MSTIINSQKIIQAEQTIRKIIHQPTPLVPSLIYNNLFYKQDFLQYTGSFKLRGASYKLLSLLQSSSQLNNNNHSINSNSINNNSINNNELNNNNKKLTVVTASTGNHGYAIAYAAKQLNINAIIFVPENADISKIENIKRLLNHSNNNSTNGNNLIKNDNSKIIIFGNDCLDCELEAKRFAKENNLNYISPYNDYDIIIGQGTIAVEMNDQLQYFLNHSLQYNLQNLTSLQKDNNKIKKDGKNLNFYISVGGGGLISGIAIYLKEIYKNCKIYGCQPQNSAVMYYSLLQNKILTNDEIKEEEETISDGTAGGIEENTITFKYCKDLIDEFILVSELEIKESLKFLVEKEKVLVEGAAAVALACYRKKMLLKQQQQQQEWMEGKKDGDDEGSDKDDEEYHIVVLCGRNISLDKLKDILMM